jgi:uncharacterized membrane protein YhaH (DUF805 family)
MEAMMLGQFFGFEGRVGRGTWWLGYLLSVFLLVIAWALIAAAQTGGLGGNIAMNLFSLACSLAAMVVSVCVTVKRYHDRDKSGFWWFIGLVPFLGLWQLIECGFCSGEDAPNRFGPPPGSATRRADLESEIGGLSSSGAMSKLDDNYMADYARKIALQQAEAQARSAQPTLGGGNAAPVFGKR